MPNTDMDLVSLDRRLSAILGQDYAAESMDVDLRSLDKRIAEAEVLPPIDYRTGSTDYREAFSNIGKNSLFIDSEDRIFISGDVAFGVHGLLSFRVYLPTEFLQIVCEHNTGEFTDGMRESLFEGFAVECMACFVWDPEKDFSAEEIHASQGDQVSLADSLEVNKLINIPPSLIETFFGYSGNSNLTFDKKIRFAVAKDDDTTDLLVAYLRFAGYNKEGTGRPLDDERGFCALATSESTYSFSSEYKPQKAVILTPSQGLGYLFDGILNPFGYKKINTDDPFDAQSWKFDGTDGILLQGVPGQPLEGEFADKIPPEWHDL